MPSSIAMLMVVTNHDRIDADHATGVWFEEFAVPYQRFRERGYGITVASPCGGPAPIDPGSLPVDPRDPAIAGALTALHDTVPLAGLDCTGFDAVFFPGGYGTMFDLPDNPDVADLVSHAVRDDKLVALVCHGPAALLGATRADGMPVVHGRRITAFTNEEEAVVELDARLPFLLESRLRELGAEVTTRLPWHDHVVIDRRLVTGQNPQSSASIACTVIRLMSQ